MAAKQSAKQAAFVANAGSATEIQPGRFGPLMPSGNPQALVARTFEPRLDRVVDSLAAMAERVCLHPEVDTVVAHMNPTGVLGARATLQRGFLSGSLLGLVEALSAKHESVTGVKGGRALASTIHEEIPADAAAYLGHIGEFKHTNRGRLMVVGDHDGLTRRIVRSAAEVVRDDVKRSLFTPANAADTSLDGVVGVGVRRILHGISGVWVREMDVFSPQGRVVGALSAGATPEQVAALNFAFGHRPLNMAGYNSAPWWFLVREALGIPHDAPGWAAPARAPYDALSSEAQVAEGVERAQAVWEQARARLPMQLVGADLVGKAPATIIQSAELVGPVGVRSLSLIEDPGGDAARVAFLAPMGWIRAEDAWEVRAARVTSTQPVRQAAQRWTQSAVT